MATELSKRSIEEILKECEELRHCSPHPSRPHIPTTVDEETWQRVHMIFQRLHQNLETSSSEHTAQTCEGLLALCTFVRNAAAMCPDNQLNAERAQVVSDVLYSVRQMVACEMAYPEAMRAGTAAMQALANLATGNKPVQRMLVSSELEHMDAARQSVYWLTLCSTSSRTSMAALVLVLNSIKDDAELARRLCASEEGRRVAHKIGKMFGNVDDESEAKDVMYAVLEQLIQHACLPALLTREPGLHMYGLLESLAAFCRENPAELTDIAGSPELIDAFSSTMQKVHTVLVQVWGEMESTVDTSQIIAAHRSLGALLSALGVLTTDCARSTADAMLHAHLVSRTVDLLALLTKHLPRVESAAALQRPKQAAEESSTRPLFMFKRGLIRVLGNLAHGHEAVQDEVRELGGLALVLDHMKIDDNHPFIKEYAVVALRCLVEGNKRSQDFIQAMNKIGDAPPSAHGVI
ncbi:Ataxin-10 [Coemansia sp. RSA 2607]|nr:Ataxin-10 [Coemansia sp. RSA 2607]